MQLVDWPVHELVGSLQTTRHGGFSTEPYESFNLGFHVGDDTKNVKANHDLLNTFLPAPAFWLNQVHGNQVVVVNNRVENRDAEPIVTGDALYTRLRCQPLAVMTADCLPILLASTNGKEIAAIHGGWRPLAAQIILKTINQFESSPQDIIAWLGPAIGPEIFEVGEDVVHAFTSINSMHEHDFLALKGDKYLANIFAIAKRQLADLGIKHIFSDKTCTFSSPNRHFSYRRCSQTGRSATIIWRK